MLPTFPLTTPGLVVVKNAISCKNADPESLVQCRVVICTAPAAARELLICYQQPRVRISCALYYARPRFAWIPLVRRAISPVLISGVF